LSPTVDPTTLGRLDLDGATRAVGVRGDQIEPRVIAEPGCPGAGRSRNVLHHGSLGFLPGGDDPHRDRFDLGVVPAAVLEVRGRDDE
jgi:hypothetical protein